MTHAKSGIRIYAPESIPRQHPSPRYRRAWALLRDLRDRHSFHQHRDDESDDESDACEAHNGSLVRDEHNVHGLCEDALHHDEKCAPRDDNEESDGDGAHDGHDDVDYCQGENFRLAHPSSEFRDAQNLVQVSAAFLDG